MNIDLTKTVKATIKAWGDKASEHFGIKQGFLDGYVKRGKYPLKLIQQILAEQQQTIPVEEPMPQFSTMGQERLPETNIPVMPMPERPVPEVAYYDPRVGEIVKYIQGTLDFYVKQHSARIDQLEKMVQLLRVELLRRAGMPNASLARPDQGVAVDQVFTTNPNAGVQPFGGGGMAPLDSGFAPTKAEVDAQMFMPTVEGGMNVLGRGDVAHPAYQIPNQPAFGFGWNEPRKAK